jgi:hypothetical protein
MVGSMQDVEPRMPLGGRDAHDDRGHTHRGGCQANAGLGSLGGYITSRRRTALPSDGWPTRAGEGRGCKTEARRVPREHVGVSLITLFLL